MTAAACAPGRCCFPARPVWSYSGSTASCPGAGGWWTGRKWWGRGRRWRGRRWTACESASGKPSPPSSQGTASTTGPAGSTVSSRWWMTSRWQCSSWESSSELWGCCCESGGDGRLWTPLGGNKQLCHAHNFSCDSIHDSILVENTRLTVPTSHAAGYLHEDSSVAEDHDDQRQEEEAHEGEHVVERLLPVLHEAAAGCALGEVLWDCDGHVVKYKHLREKRRTVLLSNELQSVSQTEWV